jgi:putative membrane protein
MDMNALVGLIINTIAIVIAAYLLPGIMVTGFWAALVVAMVLGLINGFIKPVLFILTLPLTILTLGLFSLVLNVLLIMLAGVITPGFDVQNFWWALLFSILVSLLNGFLQAFAKPAPKNESGQTTYLH